MKFFASHVFLAALMLTGCSQSPPSDAPPVAQKRAPRAELPGPEPIYHGKSLDYWLDELKDADVLSREEALEVLAQAGNMARRAAPAIEPLLKDSSSQVRIKAAFALWRVSGESESASAVLGAVASSDPTQRIAAANFIAQMGPAACSAARSLVEAFTDLDPTVEDAILRAYQRMGPGAVPGLIDGMRHASILVRERSARALARIRPAPVEAASSLVERLQDEAPLVRRQAALTLWKLHTNLEAAIPALVEALADPEQRRRREVCFVLFQERPRRKEVIPACEAAFKNEDMLIRVLAAETHWDIEKRSNRVIPVLLEAARGNVRESRTRALGALNRMGPDAKAAIPSLAELLKSTDPDAQLQAAYALGTMGKDAIPALVDGFRAKWPGRYINLAMPLAQIGPDALPSLLRLLEHDNPEIRLAIAWSFSSAGPRSVEAAPRLASHLLHDASPSVRSAAAAALGRMGPGAEASIPALLTGTADSDAEVRRISFEALRQISPKTDRVRSAFLKGIEDKHAQVRIQAILGLAEAEPENERLIPAVLPLLRTDVCKKEAIEYLGSRKGKAKQAEPALRALLQDRDPTVRKLAKIALDSIASGGQ